MSSRIVKIWELTSHGTNRFLIVFGKAVIFRLFARTISYYNISVVGFFFCFLEHHFTVLVNVGFIRILLIWITFMYSSSSMFLYIYIVALVNYCC